MVQLRLATQSAPTSPIVDNKLTFEKVRHWTWEQVSHWLQENNFKEYERLFAGQHPLLYAISSNNPASN